MDDLRPADGWEYLKRGMGDDLVLKNEDESTPEVLVTVEADVIFSSFYERESSVDEIADQRGLKSEKIEEVIDYAETSTRHMHELARASRDKSKMIEEACGEKFEKIAERALDEDSSSSKYDTSYIDYEGAVGEFQDMVEEKVDSRGLKVRYDPDEDQQHRSRVEMHVLTGKGAGEEMYFGAYGETFYIGSTVSEADKEFKTVEDIRDAEEIIDQELNVLSI